MSELPGYDSPETQISVQMLDGGHPLIRFPFAFATRRSMTPRGENIERLAGQINLSIETLEEAITLRDALSAFIAFHQAMKEAAE